VSVQGNEGGIVPVARSHAELLAGGLARRDTGRGD
jgi:hypothetical protein